LWAIGGPVKPHHGGHRQRLLQNTQPKDAYEVEQYDHRYGVPLNKKHELQQNQLTVLIENGANGRYNKQKGGGRVSRDNRRPVHDNVLKCGDMEHVLCMPIADKYAYARVYTPSCQNKNRNVRQTHTQRN
ncbi:hypothetical protein TcCL_NonESM03168, partial [Trypanosoma cruzi]